jgi:hypothetical protein
VGGGGLVGGGPGGWSEVPSWCDCALIMVKVSAVPTTIGWSERDVGPRGEGGPRRSIPRRAASAARSALLDITGPDAAVQRAR